MKNYTPVEGNSALYRDTESTAIINRDKKAYLAYMQRKKDAENKNDELNKIYEKLEEIINEFSPIIPLYYDMSVRLKQKNIFGLKNNPLNILDLKTVYKKK